MVEVIVLGLLALWGGWALRQACKKKGACGGCAGSCGSCPHGCNRKSE